MSDVRAIVLADGEAPTRAGLDATWPGWDDAIELVVAADGGARLAEPLGLRIDRWVGDGDSVDPALLARLERDGVAVRRVPTEKDESDTELALLEALGAGATDVTILGALGGPRVDHGLANLALLAHPALRGHAARLLDAATRIRLVEGPGRCAATGRVGDIVSLLPMDGGVDGVTTSGLRYPLGGESLELGRPRGLSNVRTAETATVAVRTGRLLIVESPATVRP
jgi:thiamine pyrophosphokinase